MKQADPYDATGGLGSAGVSWYLVTIEMGPDLEGPRWPGPTSPQQPLTGPTLTKSRRCSLRRLFFHDTVLI